MNEENSIKHGFRLRVAGDEGPTIFLWPILPESIQNIQALDSGGASVTVKLSNSDSITQAVVESKEKIEMLIARCQQLDEECQDSNHNC
jgi:hypothetical protein